MSPRSPAPTATLKDSPLEGLLDTAARLVLTVSAVATLICLGFLVFYYVMFAGGAQPGGGDQALALIGGFGRVFAVSCAVLAVATAYLFWGEEILGALQLMFAAALYFSPQYLPHFLGDATSEQAARSLAAIQHGGAWFGVVAIGVILIDLVGRIRLRAREGSRADQLKYGKGIKEEADVRNVFMGKCWQLPYCRKFVRERCPIYHARRTCWKERVGCMCEEQVIQNAMSGKVIPRDVVAAAKFIPYNTRLPMAAKAERCRQCAIYNEHQKHKYQLALPTVVLGIVAIYLLARQPMLDAVGGLIVNVDQLVGRAALREGPAGGAAAADPASLLVFKEILVVCLLLVAMAYMLRLIEYLFFKAKV
jgi:hypothetical protein